MEPEAPVCPPSPGLLYVSGALPANVLAVAGASFEVAETCLSMLVSAVSKRWTVCGSQTAKDQKRERHGSDLARKGLLDEWG
jgi:hypothetical protein